MGSTEVDCTELLTDEQIALAGALNDSFHGSALAMIKGKKIVFDLLSGPPPDAVAVERVVSDFVRRRKDAEHYSIERTGDSVIVHSPDPFAAAHERKKGGLPPNMMKCPFCGFVTPYEEIYVVHYRAHGFT